MSDVTVADAPPATIAISLLANEAGAPDSSSDSAVSAAPAEARPAPPRLNQTESVADSPKALAAPVAPPDQSRPAVPELPPRALERLVVPEVLPPEPTEILEQPKSALSSAAAVRLAPSAGTAVATSLKGAGRGERTDAESAAAAVDRMPSFVSEVRRRIESRKRYPALARRRREEGRVGVKVAISSSGSLRKIEVEEGAPLSLRRATRAAVEGAAPFPVPPRGDVVVEISILWQMRR